MADPTRRAVALLSGGMDSAVAAALVAEDGYGEVHALVLDYGQRHRVEIDAALGVADLLGLASATVVRVDLSSFGGSALTADLAVPKDRGDPAIGADIPITYVPARNTVFLSLALAAAEARGGEAIVIGANAVDYSGYPDCRPAFLEAFEAVARLGTKWGVEGHPFHVLAPLLHLTKADIVREGTRLGVPFGETHSCYDPVEHAGTWIHCGHCDACRLRQRGFAEARIADPTRYA